MVLAQRPALQRLDGARLRAHALSGIWTAIGSLPLKDKWAILNDVLDVVEDACEEASPGSTTMGDD